MLDYVGPVESGFRCLCYVAYIGYVAYFAYVAYIAWFRLPWNHFLATDSRGGVSLGCCQSRGHSKIQSRGYIARQRKAMQGNARHIISSRHHSRSWKILCGLIHDSIDSVPSTGSLGWWHGVRIQPMNPKLWVTECWSIARCNLLSSYRRRKVCSKCRHPSSCASIESYCAMRRIPPARWSIFISSLIQRSLSGNKTKFPAYRQIPGHTSCMNVHQRYPRFCLAENTHMQLDKYKLTVNKSTVYLSTSSSAKHRVASNIGIARCTIQRVLRFWSPRNVRCGFHSIAAAL